MRYICLLLGGLLLASCQTTQQLASSLQSKWIGRSADQFFIDNGAPRSSYTMRDGGRIYSWVGGQKSIDLPGTGQTTTNVIGNTAFLTTTYQDRSELSQTTTNFIGNTAFSTTTHQDRSELRLGCAVQIVTDKSGIITTIKPTADTIGMWQLSRCAEIFGI